MSTEKIFANGFVWKRKETAPDFVIGNLSCKVEEAIVFLKEHMKRDGWCNMCVKMSQAGKPYIELDTWEPTKQEEPTKKEEPEPEESFEDYDQGDLPF